MIIHVKQWWQTFHSDSFRHAIHDVLKWKFIVITGCHPHCVNIKLGYFWWWVIESDRQKADFASFHIKWPGRQVPLEVEKICNAFPFLSCNRLSSFVSPKCSRSHSLSNTQSLVTAVCVLQCLLFLPSQWSDSRTKTTCSLSSSSLIYLSSISPLILIGLGTAGWTAAHSGWGQERRWNARPDVPDLADILTWPFVLVRMTFGRGTVDRPDRQHWQGNT